MSLDPQYKTDRNLAAKLPRVWQAFFGKYGRFTEIQRQAILPILEGHDAVLCAATASGKTEAACAPLIERNLQNHGAAWTILYVSPTRALVNDLHARLEGPLGFLGLDLVRRTGDHPTHLSDCPHVLLTTPESFDSLLCRGVFRSQPGHALAKVTAVVLDEIHLLHGSPRGEMLKWLLQRLKLLRGHAHREAWAKHDQVQVVALSATLSNPGSVIREYLPGGIVIHAAGSRRIEVVSEGVPIEQCLPTYLGKIERPEKILVFCNSRKRADTLARDLADQLQAHSYAFAVHHGSLAKDLREDTEEKFHREKRIVVFATSTLELGIDIGDIDLVVLDSAPPDVSSLLQRIGRGNRRRNETRVMMCSSSLKDRLFQSALMAAAQQSALNDPYRGPHHSVALQQVASYVFQAPERTRQREKVDRLMARCASPLVADMLVSHMLEAGELVLKREGLALGAYWVELTDAGKIHSVIESAPGSTLIDEKTGAAIATGIDYRGGSRVKLLGRDYEVKGVEPHNRVVVGTPGNGQASEAQWRYVTSGRGRPQSPAREVRSLLGFGESEWVLFRNLWLFHFGGAPRQEVLALLAPGDAGVEEVTGIYVRFQAPITFPVRWMESASTALVSSKVPAAIDPIERKLGLPYASKRLPLPVRVDQVTCWLNVEKEISAIRTARFVEELTPEQEEGLSILIGT